MVLTEVLGAKVEMVGMAAKAAMLISQPVPAGAGVAEQAGMEVKAGTVVMAETVGTVAMAETFLSLSTKAKKP
jgi:galactokinase